MLTSYGAFNNPIFSGLTGKAVPSPKCGGRIIIRILVTWPNGRAEFSGTPRDGHVGEGYYRVGHGYKYGGCLAAGPLKRPGEFNARHYLAIRLVGASPRKGDVAAIRDTMRGGVEVTEEFVDGSADVLHRSTFS